MKTVSALLLLFIFSSSILAQADSSPSVNNIEYQQAMELLFPRDALEKRSLYFCTVLRYEPSFEPESQIVIIGREGYADVIEYRSLNGNLFYKLDDLLRMGDITVTDFAKQVHISRRTFKIPFALAQTWRKGLLDGVAIATRPTPLRYVKPSDTVTVVTDGTKYEIWDSGTSGKLHFEVWGGKLHKRVYPLSARFITWMDRVNLNVAKNK